MAVAPANVQPTPAAAPTVIGAPIGLRLKSPAATGSPLPRQVPVTEAPPAPTPTP